MSNKSLTALIVGVVVVIAAWNCFYIVSQTCLLYTSPSPRD